MLLSKRLSTIAGYVNKGDIVADIGTDHAQLPIFLVLNNICPQVIAADLNVGPVAKARANVDQAGLKLEVDVRIGSGLTVLKPGEVDTVIIAGMGADTIVGIFKESSAVIESLKKLILQPMTDEPILRTWLANNNWLISEEELVEEDGKIYTIIKGIKGEKRLSQEQILFGPELLRKKHPLLIKKIKDDLEHKRAILEQVNRSNSKKAVDKAIELKVEIDCFGKVLQWLSSVR